MEESKIISLNIPKTMYDWLEVHPEINRSELFREAVHSKQTVKSQKVSSLLFLASVMGIVFSIVLIGIGTQPSWLDVYIRGTLCLLGGILALTTMGVYYKEKKRLKTQ